MQTFLGSVRVALGTIAVCVVGYAAVVLVFAQIVTPDTANGSLITRADGSVVGSRMIAQEFTEPGYFWPRPSAVGFNAAGAAGSNKSPTSSDLADRAVGIIEQYGATADNPLPPELAAASGAGLDPHISEGAALYQAARVAEARGLDVSAVEGLIDQNAFFPGGRALTSERIVNVLELNLALDGPPAGTL